MDELRGELGPRDADFDTVVADKQHCLITMKFVATRNHVDACRYIERVVGQHRAVALCLYNYAAFRYVTGNNIEVKSARLYCMEDANTLSMVQGLLSNQNASSAADNDDDADDEKSVWVCYSRWDQVRPFLQGDPVGPLTTKRITGDAQSDQATDYVISFELYYDHDGKVFGAMSQSAESDSTTIIGPKRASAEIDVDERLTGCNECAASLVK